jgi:hypothetical protein
MKKLGFSLLLLAIALMLGGNAFAQNVGDNSVYFVTYYANNSTATAVPDATLRIVNDGSSAANSDSSLWASIYVFDDSQELTECCSCYISADGLLSESVKNQLTQSPLTGLKPSRGVIKVISSSVDAGGPKNDYPTSNFTNTPTAGLRGWATHIQSAANKFVPPTGGVGPAPYFQTEEELADSNLSAGEESMLEMLCKFDYLLSGKPCHCTPEDFDF